MARSSTATKKRRSTSVSIDFTGVQSRQKLPEDDYLAVVDEVNQTESQSGNDQLEFVFKVKEGKFEGNNLWFYCPLTENSLWKLHGLLTALGVDVPDDEMDLDLEDLPGRELMAVVTHEVFEGVRRSKMTDFYPVEESSPPKKETAKKSTKKDEEEEEEKEKPMTEAEKRKARRDARKQKKATGSTKSKAKDEEEDEEEEEEEEPKAKKGAASKTKKMPKLSSDTVQEMDEDDLQEVIDEYKLEVDLDEFRTLRKKAAAVVDALEAEEMLEE
jgi:Protein of unknown function (DUF669)